MMTTLGLYPISPKTTVPCIICLQKVTIRNVTAGSLYADGRQAFACSNHLAERATWIITWAVFDYQQHQMLEIARLAEEL